MENTLNQVFRNRVNKYGDRFCVEKKLKGKWETATWREYYERARNTGLGLYELGVKKGDMVAILSQNRLEWIYTDMGALGIGACVIPIYATVKSDEVEYILNNSNSKVVVVENADQLEKINRIKTKCPSLQKTVVIDTTGCVTDGHDTLSFSDLMATGSRKAGSDPGLFEKLADQVGPDDLATFQYTSGTTGLPKGAIHTHGTLMAELRALDATRPQYGYESDHVVGFLPLSHIFERVPVHFYVMYKGITKSYAESIETVAADIQEKKPTILFAVPRVLEKIYQKMLFTISGKPPIVQKLFAWAQGVGDLISKYSEEKKTPPPLVFGSSTKLPMPWFSRNFSRRWAGESGGCARRVHPFHGKLSIFSTLREYLSWRVTACRRWPAVQPSAIWMISNRDPWGNRSQGMILK